MLQPIPLPEQKWQQITTDLVTDLPKFEGKPAISIFVARLSKMAHFALCTKEISVEKYAQLFVDHVFKHHGLPEVIISNRDPQFTSRFWRELSHKLGTDLRFSMAFHPQTDGHSEVTIRVLENFLRQPSHLGTAAAPRKVRGEQRSLHQYRVHPILSEHRRSPDFSSVDDAWWDI